MHTDIRVVRPLYHILSPLQLRQGEGGWEYRRDRLAKPVPAVPCTMENGVYQVSFSVTPFFFTTIPIYSLAASAIALMLAGGIFGRIASWLGLTI